MRKFIERFPVLTFIILTLAYQFVVVGVVWSQLSEGQHLHDDAFSHMIFRLRVFGPLVFAVLLTIYLEGTSGLRKLFGAFFNWRVPLRWYALGFGWKFLFTYLGVGALTLFGVVSWPGWVVDDFFGAFDCPDAGQPAPKRTSSTTPLQALNLLNGGFALQQAGHLAERIRKEAGEQPEAQIRRLYALVYNRPPSTEDLSDSAALLREHGLQTLCRALLNSNEFIHLY